MEGETEETREEPVAAEEIATETLDEWKDKTESKLSSLEATKADLPHEHPELASQITELRAEVDSLREQVSEIGSKAEAVEVETVQTADSLKENHEGEQPPEPPPKRRKGWLT